ncbi:hotdog family protein [Halodesulfovibrio marinisediminis]|uniref:Uncharacterized protein n=1 Tax=Halodesulfovibrio marinisediminis DSM 17456 TaxID=1121457 RepID=A0A1N6IR10_9BACT|nr:hypothetical protein [Halodesulfovibrio marinisediminis]SIO34487.1 hypothetical protein SAMN02745161_2846 [Halodesulfovibrio marinisediminis DSM 17456]
MQYSKTIHFDVDRFIMLDSITHYAAETLTAEKEFVDAPAYLALEAMAQTGGLHFRKCMNFSRHAFLLSIQQSPLLPVETFSGCATTIVVQTAMTKSTAAYDISFTCQQLHIEGSFLFGSTEFGEQFSKDSLTTHYRELFQCLQNAYDALSTFEKTPACTAILSLLRSRSVAVRWLKGRS